MIQVGNEPISQPEPYKVLPNIYPVMGFQYAGSLSQIRNGKLEVLKRSGISGLLTSYKLFQTNDESTKTILIRLKPWAASVLLNEAAYHFTDQAIGLNEIVTANKIRVFEEQLLSINSFQMLSEITQNFLLNLLKDSRHPLPLNIIKLSQNILTYPTVNSIAQFAKENGISQKTLERYFKEFIGLSPKRFSMTIRFQNTIQALYSGISWEEIIDKLGYYDQSHFIHELKKHTGMLPAQIIL
jgi:AraC-like DNA-binding protein